MTRPRDIADSINRINSSAADATAMTIDSSERVGVGTTSPIGDGIHVKVPDDAAGLVLSGTTTTAGTDVKISAVNEAGSAWHNLNIGSNNVIFRAAGTEKARITTSGLTFNGDTAAANALDDYEEGTWTATIGNGTVSANSLRYVKIGQQVTVWGYLQSFSDRSTAAAVNISGLPFTSASDNYASGATFHRYINANGDMVTAYIPISTTTMTFYSSVKNSQYVNVLHSHLSASSSVIFFTISYRA